jgi:hypothetical protein
MRATNLAEMIGDLGIKAKHFLMMTLNPDPSLRMGPQDLFNFKFDLAPKINLSKLLTFSQNPPSPPILAPRQSEQIRESKVSKASEMQDLFGNASPIRLHKETTQFLQASCYDQEASKVLKGKEISILAPPEIRRNRKSAVESNASLDYEPSFLRMPTEKEQSQSSYNSKNSKSKHILELNSKINIEMSTDLGRSKCLGSPMPRQDRQPTQIGQLSPESTSIKTITVGKQRTYKRPGSPVSGPESTIEVNVHSPIRIPQGSLNDPDVIANWLLSRVDLSRFLTRTCYQLNKIGYS